MRWFDPPEARRRRRAIGARPQRVRPWSDPDALAGALLRTARPALVLDATGDEALDLLAAGHRVTVAPGAGTPLLAYKRAAIAGLRVHSARAALGLDAFGRRIWFYHHLRDQLDDASRDWWDAREHLVLEGILGMGALEHALGQRRERALAGLGLSDREPAWTRDAEAQSALGRRLSGRRGALRFGLWTRGLPEASGVDLDGLQARVGAILAAGRLADSPDLLWLLTGDTGQTGPRWLSPETWAELQDALGAGQLTTVEGPLLAALAELPADHFGALVCGVGTPRAALAAAAPALAADAVVVGPVAWAPADAAALDEPLRLLHPARAAWPRP